MQMKHAHLSTADKQMQGAMNTMDQNMMSLRLSGKTDRDFMMMMIPITRLQSTWRESNFGTGTIPRS